MTNSTPLAAVARTRTFLASFALASLLAACAGAPPTADAPGPAGAATGMPARSSAPLFRPAPATMATRPAPPAAGPAEAGTPSAGAVAALDLDPLRNVFFPTGEAAVPSAAIPAIASVSDRLKVDPRLDVQLIGYADDLVSSEYCLALASKRTVAVENELIRRGVRPNQVRKTPLGRDDAAPCPSGECPRQGRRVELRIVE